MKFLLTLLSAALVFSFIGTVRALPLDDLESQGEATEGKEKAAGVRPPWSEKCPMGAFYHLEVADCFDCHTKDMRLKEVEWDAHLDYPLSSTDIIQNADGKYGYVELHGSVSDVAFTTSVEWLYEHGIRHIVIDIMSPGGGMFSAWRIIATMDRYRQKGVVFEAQVDGFAASAAFLVFVGADIRAVTPYSFLMWHEVWTFKMFDVSTPSSKEEEARVLRKFQDNLNGYIAAHTQLTKDQVDDLVKKKEMWLTGEEALERGIATKLIEDAGLVMGE